MRIFITGATGYIGSAVAEALLARGHAVHGLARSERAVQALEAKGVRPHPGDLYSPETVAGGARHSDAVIHCALSQDPNAPLADEAATDAILEALAGTGRTFIYTSGVWVMGNTGPDADEDSPPAPPPFVAWRVSVELKVLDAARRGLRAIVIRPAVAYGRGGGLVEPFVKSARETGAAVVVGDGENHWTFVHLDDLADLYARTLEAPPGTLLIGAAGKPRKVRDVARLASRAAGAGDKVQFWPIDEAFNQLGPLAEGLALDQRVSGKRAERLLGWKPQAPSLEEEFERGSYAGRRAAG